MVQQRPRPARRPEPETPRFASEAVEDDDEVAPPLKPEELRPVPASVFDDEFFRSTVRSVAERETEAEAEAAERYDDVSLSGTVQYERGEEQRMQETELAERNAAPPPRAPEPQNDPEPDELDIPAFLRRSSS